MTITDLPAGPETAAQHASRNVPQLPSQTQAVQALNLLQGHSFDSASVIAVCTGERLAGLVTIERLLSAQPGETLADIMDANPPVITPGTDQEHAAWKALQHKEPGLAVVEESGRFVGLISPQQLLRVLLEEHDEDLARIGGYVRSTAQARDASEESVPRRLWHRLPWLGVGLVGVFISASLLAAFEARLNAMVAVAFFLPGIVYLAAAVGNQTQTLAVRGMSVGVGIKNVAIREAVTGLLVGIFLAGVMYALVAIGWHEPRLALAVAAAVAVASLSATLVGMALPWLLQRAGRDPAFGSGPVATIIQDLTSISVYMGSVTLLL